MKTNLSVIILSYNTKKLTQKCVISLIDCLSKNKGLETEIIIVDNGSRDGSAETIKKIQITKSKISNIKFKITLNKENIGYAKANNQGLKIASGKYILFLNSDTIVKEVDFNKLISYFENRPEVSVLTVKVLLPNGSIDPASHRGFPTVWNSFCYLSKLEKLFGNVYLLNRIFGGYHLKHLNLSTIHEIDSGSGAFYLTRKDILNKVNGFDEKFFMYGEDIDLSFQIKELGYKIIYYPSYTVIHLKHASGLETIDRVRKKETKKYFYDAMKIFYKKHYQSKYPNSLNKIVYLIINILKKRYV